MTLPVPTEAQEAQMLVAWLRLRGIWFFHVPNESGHDSYSRRRAVRVKREGAAKGMCDYVVLLRPEQTFDGDGLIVAIELKRAKKSLSRVSPEQRVWVDRFNSINDRTAATISYGANEAIAVIENLMTGRAA